MIKLVFSIFLGSPLQISVCKYRKFYLTHYFPSTSSFWIPLFLPDFCQFGFENEAAGFRPDRMGQNFKPGEPDRLQKICPVPTLSHSNATTESFVTFRLHSVVPP